MQCSSDSISVSLVKETRVHQWAAVEKQQLSGRKEDVFSCIFHPLLYLTASVFAIIRSSYQRCSSNSPLSYAGAPELAPSHFHHANWSCITKRRIWPSSWLDQILTSCCCQMTRGENNKERKAQASLLLRWLFHCRIVSTEAALVFQLPFWNEQSYCVFLWY